MLDQLTHLQVSKEQTAALVPHSSLQAPKSCAPPCCPCRCAIWAFGNQYAQGGVLAIRHGTQKTDYAPLSTTGVDGLVTSDNTQGLQFPILTFWLVDHPFDYEP